MHFWRDCGTTYIALHDYGVMEDWCMKAIHGAFEKHDVQIFLDSLSLICSTRFTNTSDWAIGPKRGARLLNRLLKRTPVHKSEVGYERILKIL